MHFNVIFHYMDDETFHVEVSPDDMERFMNTLGKSEVYFDNAKGIGLWVPVDKIRYFQVERVDEQGNRIIESPSEVSISDKGDSRGSIEEGAESVGKPCPVFVGKENPNDPPRYGLES